MNIKLREWIFSILCFAFPCCLYLFTRPDSFLFLDAAEFGIVTKIAGIAHPPGTPAYVLLGFLWSKLLSLFSSEHFFNVTLFSITSASIASLLFYKSIKLIFSKTLSEKNYFQAQLIALITALVMATGATTWFWANAVEVYAFQLFCMALLFFGLTHYHFHRKIIYVIVAAIAFGLGLANHHFTIALIAPFMLFFFDEYLFSVQQLKSKKKKVSAGFFQLMWNIFISRPFLIMIGVTTSVAVFFYGWMMFRSDSDVLFRFGKPDNVLALWQHLSLHSYNISQYVPGIAGMRFPYFVDLIFNQYLIFIPLLLMGIYLAIIKKLFRLLLMILIYFFILFIFQLRADQVGDSDGYFLLPFFMLSIFVAYGIYSIIRINKAIILVLICALAGNIYFNFSRVDKRNYNGSRSLMAQLDRSAPPKSVILIADWSLVIQYYYYRIVENFRPDLIVINYDIKFADCELLPKMYPAFYQFIKPEYDHFVTLLGNAHPDELYGTGLSLDSQDLMDSFHKVISKIEEYGTKNNVAILTDPKAHVHYTQFKFYSPSRYVSGCFISSLKADDRNDDFLKLDMKWLNSPILLNDAGAVDKMVDLNAMLDFDKKYFEATRDTVRYNLADQQYSRTTAIMRKMKLNIPYAFRKNK